MDTKKLLNKKNLLIGCTGSIATIRLDQIIKAFKNEFNIKIILTCNSKIFANRIIGDSYPEYEIEHNVKFYFDEDEFKVYREQDLVLHIELRKWADAVLLAPLSANTLAKITNGLCDNLLVIILFI